MKRHGFNYQIIKTLYYQLPKSKPPNVFHLLQTSKQIIINQIPAIQLLFLFHIAKCHNPNNNNTKSSSKSLLFPFKDKFDFFCSFFYNLWNSVECLFKNKLMGFCSRLAQAIMLSSTKSQIFIVLKNHSFFLDSFNKGLPFYHFFIASLFLLSNFYFYNI